MKNRTIKKYNSIKQKRNKVKSRKNKRMRRKGGTKNENENIKCSMCESHVKKKDTLVPRVCLNEHGRKAHRICSECWWNPETGFAREDARHGCPGCEKKLPLTNVSNVLISHQPVKVIDLTED